MQKQPIYRLVMPVTQVTGERYLKVLREGSDFTKVSTCREALIPGAYIEARHAITGRWGALVIEQRA